MHVRLARFQKVHLQQSGGFQINSMQGSTGCLIHDADCRLLQARAKWYHAVASALSMEAFALRVGVWMAVEMRKQKVIVESDSQVLVKFWSSDAQDRSEIAPIIKEVKELTRVYFSFQS